jgi:hypothetical protein
MEFCVAPPAMYSTAYFSSSSCRAGTAGRAAWRDVRTGHQRTVGGRQRGAGGLGAGTQTCVATQTAPATPMSCAFQMPELTGKCGRGSAGSAPARRRRVAAGTAAAYPPTALPAQPMRAHLVQGQVLVLRQDLVAQLQLQGTRTGRRAISERDGGAGRRAISQACSWTHPVLVQQGLVHNRAQVQQRVARAQNCSLKASHFGVDVAKLQDSGGRVDARPNCQRPSCHPAAAQRAASLRFHACTTCCPFGPGVGHGERGRRHPTWVVQRYAKVPAR